MLIPLFETIVFQSSFQIDDYVKQHRDKTLPAVRFITVPRSAACGHNHIYSYPKFHEIVRYNQLINSSVLQFDLFCFSDLSFLKHSPPA